MAWRRKWPKSTWHNDSIINWKSCPHHVGKMKEKCPSED